MAAPRQAHAWRLAAAVRRHLGEAQNRTTYLLIANTLLGAATGFLFWLLLARLGLRASAIGIGYTAVALGTLVAVIAKGGLDIALLQKVPGATRAQGSRLLVFAFLVGSAAALALTACLALASGLGGWLSELGLLSWSLVAGIALLLVLTWLQDAYFVAVGRTRFSLERNAVLSLGRLVLPLPIVLLALADPVALTWALALAASAAAGILRARHVPPRRGRTVGRREFLASAGRNISGGAAEALPGLLLAPLVLALNGAEAAGYFGIAWTAAALVFQTSGAIGRSTLARMIEGGSDARPAAIRRGLLHHLWLVAPLALAGAALASQLLAIFGPAYAQHGAPVLTLLCLSAIFVAPTSIYLAVLRAQDRTAALVLFPAAIIVGLAVWAPILDHQFGIGGVALAWLLANAPVGLYAAWRLLHASEGVRLPNAAPLGRPAHLE